MTNRDTKTTRPGSALIATGILLAVIAGVLIIAAFATTDVEIIPGTFTTREVQGSPGPLVYVIGIAGLILAAVGFAKRVLAAVER
jgi:hypothetical protein